MNNRALRGSLQVLCMLLLLSWSCSTTVTKIDPRAEALRKPAITLKVATLDLFNLRKRIEKRDVEQFAKTLRQEQVEILAVQGIARYPTVKSRIDFVNELVVRTEMRHIFGQTVNNMGRQSGNAVFSIYPIRFNRNTEYELKSPNSESALQVAVDAGIKEVVIISTRLPEKMTNRELSSCIQTIVGLKKAVGGAPVLVMGNLPASQKRPTPGVFSDVHESPAGTHLKPASSRIWFNDDETLGLLQARTIETGFGTMTLAEFGLFSRF